MSDQYQNIDSFFQGLQLNLGQQRANPNNTGVPLNQNNPKEQTTTKRILEQTQMEGQM